MAHFHEESIIDNDLVFTEHPATGLKESVVESEATAFERLHALVRKGYRPELGSEDAGGAIKLHHLGKAPDLVLHNDGTVEDLAARIPRHKRLVREAGNIPAEKVADHLRFMKFLETVPRASLRDRTRPWRKKYIYVPAFGVAFLGLCLSFTAVLANL